MCRTMLRFFNLLILTIVLSPHYTHARGLYKRYEDEEPEAERNDEGYVENNMQNMNQRDIYANNNNIPDPASQQQQVQQQQQPKAVSRNDLLDFTQYKVKNAGGGGGGAPSDHNQVYKFEADIPGLIRSILGLPSPAARSQTEREVEEQKFKIEITPPKWSAVLQTLKQLMRRSLEEHGAYVEEAPGSVKSEIVKYPENFHRLNIQKLIRLKENRN